MVDQLNDQPRLHVSLGYAQVVSSAEHFRNSYGVHGPTLDRNGY